MYNNKDAEKVINEIKHFEKDVKPVVKAKILELAMLYEKAIEERNQLVFAKIKSIKERNKNEDPDIKDIALLINKVREENFNMISKGWLYKILPEKYKRNQNNQKKIEVSEISDKELYLSLIHI